MKKSITLICVFLLLLSSQLFSQLDNSEKSIDKSGILKGLVTDSISGEPILFCTLALYSDGKILVTGTESNLDGYYEFQKIPVGIYSLEVSYIGYQTQLIENVSISNEQPKTLDVSIVTGLTMDEITVIGHKPSITDYDCTYAVATVSQKNISRKKRKSKKKKDQPSIEPTQHQTEDYDLIVENKFHSPNDEPLSTLSIDVDRASYSNVRRFLQNGNLPPIDAVRVEELINYFDYEYEAPEKDNPFAIHPTVSECPWNSDHHILHVAIQGQKIDREEVPPSNLVFLIDVSGSMSSHNKLELVKSSLRLLVSNLRPIDKIAMVVYAGSAGLVLESTPGNQKDKILSALDKLKSGGSTAGGQGIKLAYKVAKENYMKLGNNRVILATDGDFNVGTSSDAEMVRLIESYKNDQVFLSVLGYGMGNYKDNKMQKLADNGNGNHFYIDNIEEAKKVLINEFGGTLFTIAKDVKIQIEFNPNSVKGYRLIGYENRLLDKEDFNDDSKDAGELGAGHVVTAIYEIIPKNVETEFLVSVDRLKYQKTISRFINVSDDLGTIKMRYKKPKGKKSIKLEKVISSKKERIDDNTKFGDVRFASSVALFGMLLRKSEFVQNGSYDQVIQLAESSIGLDEYAYRSEFIELVKIAKELDQPMKFTK